MRGTEEAKHGSKKKIEMFVEELRELVKLYASKSGDLTSTLAALGALLVDLAKDTGLDSDTVVELIYESLEEQKPKPMLRLIE